ncbi:arginase family protein [Secundilactobacillus oryzae]|uniref:arginase family protein n=1 Tax=Secundilactobacillus oryzae TaxID=1202668 RepID=UPI000AF771A0|nr:arginase family protein [Secundilactobacillus oryzae]
MPTQDSWTKFLVPVSQTAESTGMVDGDQALLDQHTQVRAALANVQPNRVITLGGDCAVSAVPFDYLHGRYPDDFGVIWLDAHPDISTVKDSHHFHEMVVSNLLKVSGSGFDQDIEHPLQPNQVFFCWLDRS